MTIPAAFKRFDLSGEEEVSIRRVAREIGMGILPLDTILSNHGITPTLWLQLATNQQFQRLLGEEVERWGSSLNTRERIDLKTLSMVEEALPEMYRLLHDKTFGDLAKVNLFKALQQGAGIGARDAMVGGGEKVAITINMGEDKKLTIEQTITPQVTLDHEDMAA